MKYDGNNINMEKLNSSKNLLLDSDTQLLNYINNRIYVTILFSIVFILIIVSLCVIYLIDFEELRDLRLNPEIKDSGTLTNLFRGDQQSELRKLNCDLETVYSMTDDQCNAICQNTLGNFISKHGVCVNSFNFKTEIINNECDPKRGVLAYMIGDGQFGRTAFRCMSIDQGIQPDNIDQPNKICGENEFSGTIDIDYLIEFPKSQNCKCAPDKTLIIIPGTEKIRSRGSCVPKESADIFKNK